MTYSIIFLLSYEDNNPPVLIKQLFQIMFYFSVNYQGTDQLQSYILHLYYFNIVHLFMQYNFCVYTYLFSFIC